MRIILPWILFVFLVFCPVLNAAYKATLIPSSKSHSTGSFSDLKTLPTRPQAPTEPSHLTDPETQELVNAAKGVEATARSVEEFLAKAGAMGKQKIKELRAKDPLLEILSEASELESGKLLERAGWNSETGSFKSKSDAPTKDEILLQQFVKKRLESILPKEAKAAFSEADPTASDSAKALYAYLQLKEKGLLDSNSQPIPKLLTEAITNKEVNKYYNHFFGITGQDSGEGPSSKFAAALTNFKTTDLKQATTQHKQFFDFKGNAYKGFATKNQVFTVSAERDYDYAKQSTEYNKLAANPTAENLIKMQQMRKEFVDNRLSAFVDGKDRELRDDNPTGAFTFFSWDPADNEKDIEMAVPKSLQDVFGPNVKGKQYTGYLWNPTKSEGASLEKRSIVAATTEHLLSQSGNQEDNGSSKLQLIFDEQKKKYYLQGTLNGGGLDKPGYFFSGNPTNFDLKNGAVLPVVENADLTNETGFIIGGEGHPGQERYHVQVTEKKAKFQRVQPYNPPRVSIPSAQQYRGNGSRTYYPGVWFRGCAGSA